MDEITVLIPTSPIHSHPSTEIIDETIDSIRMQLPESEIIIMVDGVREEQDHRKFDYYEYKRRLLWKCNHKWTNVRCKIFNEYSHQARMTTLTLQEVETPTILFTEHDMPLMGDRSFQWPEFIKLIKDGQANLIRFCMEPFVIDAWQHLMLDKEPQIIDGVPLLRTIQWSQRSHIASTAFYRKLLADNFTEQSRTFIEDKVHGLPPEDYRVNGEMGWLNWRLFIYAPGEDIQRCYTTDGRGDEPKYEMVF